MNLRFFPRSIHGVLDYLVSGVNLALPRVIGIEDAPEVSLAHRLSGAAALLYSPLTAYETGVARSLPVSTHLALDAIKGILLASSPWIFDHARKGPRYWLPPLLIGAIDVIGALTTIIGPAPQSRLKLEVKLRHRF